MELFLAKNKIPATIFSRSYSIRLLALPESQDVAENFSSMEEIQQNMTAGLTAISDEDFQRCFQQW
jgi:hypothetical protein